MPDYTPAAAPEVPPLIMTALLDARSFAIFDRLRRDHFPPARNVLSAHLTLFHRLPGTDLATVTAEMERRSVETGPLVFRAAAIRLLGRGVAIEIECPPLVALRNRIGARFGGVLSAQDRATFRPHVTVQNKASATAARALAPVVAASLPVDGEIEGLALHHYCGGPWRPAFRVHFPKT